MNTAWYLPRSHPSTRARTATDGVMTLLRRSGMVAVNRIVAETVCAASGLDLQTRRWPPLPVVIHNHGSRDGRDRISVPHRYIGAMLTEAGYVAFVPERSTANLNAKRGISYRAVFYEAWPKGATVGTLGTGSSRLRASLSGEGRNRVPGPLPQARILEVSAGDHAVIPSSRAALAVGGNRPLEVLVFFAGDETDSPQRG